MIIDNTYFYGEFYLPQAKPSLHAENSVASKVTDYIDEYSSMCLLKCLGYILFEEFASVLNPIRENGLEDNSAQKWSDLLNGKSYVREGKNVKWRGLRYKEIGSDKYKSLLVPYIYYYFKLQTQTSGTGTGEKTVRAKGSEVADVTPVLSRAWNKFCDQAQLTQKEPVLIERNFGFGIDYYSMNNNQYLTLNEFIRDMNEIDSNNYREYTPQKFNKFILGL
tara:strand:- start:9498 stop:10160 length:663 start_codon:yes stop_codon:yes gene_type:complete